MVWWHVLLVVICSYLFGNISVARFVAKSQNSDVTKLGSGNPGSTNILRNFGFKLGLLNLILDCLKGFIPSFVAFKIFGDSYLYLYIAGLSCIIGHIYPVIFKFKGGKGIASMLGVFFASDPLVALIVVLIAAVSWLCFEYGSVASFLCVTALTVYEGIRVKNMLENPESMVICLLLYAIFLITWFAHRGNIQRLLVGRENKVSLIKSTKKKIKQAKKKVD
ncbi:MAG: glycerol-3-phosphate 1-O-acyltransferase PlsY [Clostridia bacterium]|nr:glycerol-3-phosphate 1-O-acyltransferase PlsY [Clostridia bacterium]